MKPRYIYIPLLVGGLTPMAVILVLELIGNRRSSLTLGDLLLDLPFITAFALIPFVALIGAMRAISSGVKGWGLECVFWGGLLPIEYVIVASHSAVWMPWYFGHEHLYATSVVMFGWAPILALGYSAVGLLVGWLIYLIAAWLKRAEMR
jgi:hypothetical protein